MGVGTQPAGIARDLFGQGQEIQEALLGHRCGEVRACRFKARHFGSQVFQISIELFHGIGDKVGQVPPVGKFAGCRGTSDDTVADAVLRETAIIGAPTNE